MRNLRVFMATLVVAMSFTACSKSELDNMSITEAASVIPGTYKVNFYGDTYGDAGPFGEFTFEFFSNGTMSATSADQAFTGVWLIQTMSDEQFDKEVSITITGSPEMDMLTYAWRVMEVTDVTLQLVDDTGAEEIGRAHV